MPNSIWPYLAPYVALLTCAELESVWPGLAVPLRVARVVVPAAILWAAWRRGAYPELTGGGRRSGLADVLAGLGIAALWLAPYLLFPTLPRGEPFDTEVLGPELRPLWVGLRLVGFVLVSPLVEELFVRSFLHRAAEAWPAWHDFAGRAVGRPDLRAFAATVLWFTFSHVSWEWIVAAPTGALLNLWLYRRGALASVWLAHATANAAIAALVVIAPVDLWAFL